MPSYIRTLAIASSLLILSGCGLKGELYMPQEYYDELQAEQLAEQQRLAAEQAAAAKAAAAEEQKTGTGANGTAAAGTAGTKEAPESGSEGAK